MVDGGLLIRAEAGRMMVVHAPFCIDCQEKVKEAAGRHPILGTCYAGVTEYVFPLYAISGRTWGFICFSGFSQNPEASMERACAAAARFKIPKDKELSENNRYNLFRKKPGNTIKIAANL